MTSATALTIGHYSCPEVKEIIKKYAFPGANGAWRCLNGDFERWYGYDGYGNARLLNTKDYEDITSEFRTLYTSLNVFDPGLMGISRQKNEITADNPLGTPADTIGYTLGVDIDKGPGGDIDNPDIREAVEAAAQFLVDRLKEAGVHKSAWVLFSGGGIYVHVHHEICKPTTSDPEERKEFYELLTDCFNNFIVNTSKEFFKNHPEYIGKVKFDALNNSKRVFKCILSVHRSKPYAVTPLDRDNIKIDLSSANIFDGGLKDEVIAEAQTWYSSYDPDEREALNKLLDQYKPSEEQRAAHHFEEIWRPPVKFELTEFPPCIQHIINAANPGEGKTRFSGILSTFLYQMGWDEVEAWELVETVSDRNGLDNAMHIFESCFGRISCPSCKTIQEDAAGYPHLGLKGIWECPEECFNLLCAWPGDYPILNTLDQNDAVLTLADITTVTGKESVIDSKTGQQRDETRLKRKFNADTAFAAILKNIRLVSDGSLLWYFDGNIYKNTAESYLANLLYSVGGSIVSSYHVAETLKRLNARLKMNPVTLDPFPHLLGVTNGVVNIISGEFRDYLPEDLITNQIPVEFDPEAHCPTIIKFLEDLTPNDHDRITLLDIIASGAYRQALYYIAFLIGHGASGSTKFIELIQAFYGNKTTEAVPLRELTESRFALSRLKYARYSFGQEIDNVRKAGTERIKELSGGDWISSDVKNEKERARFRGWTKLVFKGNKIPSFTDNTYGFKRRFIQVPLPYRFVADPDPKEPNQRKEDPDILTKITTSSELSGLLNLILSRLPFLIKARTIYRRGGQYERYKDQTESVYAFLEEFCPYYPELVSIRIPIKTLYEKFMKWADLTLSNQVDVRQFGKLVSKYCEIVALDTRIDGNHVTVYPGLFFEAAHYDSRIKTMEADLESRKKAGRE